MTALCAFRPEASRVPAVCQLRRRHFEHWTGGTSPALSQTWPQSGNSQIQTPRSPVTMCYVVTQLARGCQHECYAAAKG